MNASELLRPFLKDGFRPLVGYDHDIGFVIPVPDEETGYELIDSALDVALPILEGDEGLVERIAGIVVDWTPNADVARLLALRILQELAALITTDEEG